MSTFATPPRGDFLATVVDRAQGRAAIVAPRLPGVFEPVAASADTGIGEAPDTAAASPAASPRDARDRAASLWHAPSPPRREASVAADSPVPLREASPQSVAVPLHSAVPPSPAPLHDAPASAFAARPASVPPPAAAPASDATAPMAAPPASAMPPAPPPSIAPVPSRRERAAAPLAAPSLPPSPTLLPQRDLLATFAPMPGDARDNAPAATAPVVTISIGRVDVRSTAATPAPRTSPPPRSPMRLADYLDRKDRVR